MSIPEYEIAWRYKHSVQGRIRLLFLLLFSPFFSSNIETDPIVFSSISSLKSASTSCQTRILEEVHEFTVILTHP